MSEQVSEPRYINKYVLYVQLVILTALIILAPRACQLQTYQTTTGIIEGYTQIERRGKYNRIVDLHPRIRFEVDGTSYTFLAFEHIDGTFIDNAPVKVYYNPRNPNEAFLFQKQATWGYRPYIFIVVFVILSILFLHPMLFQKRIRL
jgi:hypothetical protein